MAGKFDLRRLSLTLRSDDLLHEGQEVSDSWYKGKGHVPVDVTKAYGGADLWLY